MADKANVNTPSAGYNTMQARFALCVALMGGTLTMRAAQRTYLPQFTKESNDRYDKRLANSVLLEAYKDAVQSLASRPFGTPVALAENAPPLYEEIADDVDLTGQNLTPFCRSLLEDLLLFGKCHILVDHPNTEQLREDLGGTFTREDEHVRNIRPYFVRIAPDALIGWKGHRLFGVEKLTRIRYREETVEQVDGSDYGEQTVKRVVVWRDEVIETHRMKEQAQGQSGEEWAIEKTVTNTLGKIPLVTVYANRKSLLLSHPPLEGLAHLNQKHWRTSSDQDSIEQIARVPLLALFGFNQDETASIEIGPYKMINNKNPNARVEMVETNGRSVSVGRDGLKETKGEMEAMSMQPLVRMPGNPTATQLAIEAGREISDLEAYVMLLEKGVAQAFEFASDWRSDNLGKPEVKISQDFGPLPVQRDLEEIREDYKLGAIDQETYLKERKMRGLYSEDMDIAAVIEATEMAEGAFELSEAAGG